MSIISGRPGFAFALTLLGLGAPAAHAQSNSLPSWTSGWQSGVASGASAAPGANPYAPLLAFGGSETAGGNFSSRYNFENGWFVGSERGSGFGVNGFTPGAWSNLGSLSYEGTQFGYNFKNSPVSLYAGFDTVKYNNAIGNPLAGFDSTSNATSGYAVRAGVEVRPTSNLSLSVGASFTQPPTGIDSGGFNSVPGATSFAFGRR